jgi:uncharacterized protein YjbI with pentapeptide repeats
MAGCGKDGNALHYCWKVAATGAEMRILRQQNQWLREMAMSRRNTSDSDDRPATTALTELGVVLEGHRAWVASGWECGKRADLHGRDLHETDLSGALLSEADLHRADLHEAALRDCELLGADLHRCDLHGADLRGADLQWADLHDADLHGADLSDAVLDQADLHRADLHAADLTQAALGGADLRGADLREARGLTRAQLRAATIDDATRLPPDLDA